VIGRGGERGQDCRQQESQPFEQASEVVAGGGEDGVGGVAVGSGEVVSAHAVLRLRVADDRFDGGTAAQLAFDGLGDAASLAGDIDLELVVGRGVVAAIAAVGDDAGQARGRGPNSCGSETSLFNALTRRLRVSESRTHS
jgi:hypothetical protein